MKKLLLLTLASGLLFAADKVMTPAEINKVVEKSAFTKEVRLKSLIPFIKSGVVKDDFYVLKLQTPRGNAEVFITKDEKYLIFGNVLDNKGQAVKAEFPMNTKAIEKGVSFSFGSGKKELYVVTDPECPYCKKFEDASIKAGLDKKYRIHVILMPLSFHKNAVPMSHYILAGKTEAEVHKRFTDTVLGTDTKYKTFKPKATELQTYNARLDDAKKAADELGATGTPSVFDAKFNKVSWPTLVPGQVR